MLEMLYFTHMVCRYHCLSIKLHPDTPILTLECFNIYDTKLWEELYAMVQEKE